MQTGHELTIPRHLLAAVRDLRTDRTASTVIHGHAFIQNLRRAQYKLGVEARHEHLRVAAAIDELPHSNLNETPHTPNP